MKKLSGKTVLITGAGRGIGRATAVLFAENGADLVLISRTAHELEDTVGLCTTEGIKVSWDSVDLSRQPDIDAFLEKLVKEHPRIDILINNAAHFDAGAMIDYKLEDFRHMLQVNLIAPFYLSQRVIQVMDKTAGGAIVNISSFSGCFESEKFPGFGAYNISKYGLWGLTETMALENRQSNIRVNQISLSGVDTDMFRKAFPPGIEADLTPGYVAEHILYLACNDSAPLTGANIMLYGTAKPKS